MEWRRGRTAESTELLATAMRHRLNNLSHDVLVRSLLAGIRDELGSAEVDAVLERGGGKRPTEVLVRYGGA